MDRKSILPASVCRSAAIGPGRWYASNRDFCRHVGRRRQRCARIPREKLKNAAVSRILIERPAKNARITIFSARPGVVIGKKGEDIENLKKELATRLGVPVAVNIEEVRKPEIDAKLIADRSPSSWKNASCSAVP